MRVVRCADDKRVKVPGFFVEHLPEIMATFCVWIASKDFGREIVVEVAQGDYAFGPAVAEVALAHSADTDSGDAERVAWGLIAGASEDITGHDDWCGKAGSEKTAPG